MNRMCVMLFVYQNTESGSVSLLVFNEHIQQDESDYSIFVHDQNV